MTLTDGNMCDALSSFWADRQRGLLSHEEYQEQLLDWTVDHGLHVYVYQPPPALPTTVVRYQQASTTQQRQTTTDQQQHLRREMEGYLAAKQARECHNLSNLAWLWHLEAHYRDTDTHETILLAIHHFHQALGTGQTVETALERGHDTVPYHGWCDIHLDLSGSTEKDDHATPA